MTSDLTTLSSLEPVTPNFQSPTFKDPLLAKNSYNSRDFANEFLRDIYNDLTMEPGLQLITSLAELKRRHEIAEDTTTPKLFFHRSPDRKRFVLIFSDESVIVGTLTSRGVAKPLPFALRINNPVRVSNGSVSPSDVCFGLDGVWPADKMSALKWKRSGKAERTRALISHRGKAYTKEAEDFIRILHQEAEAWIKANPSLHLDPERLWPAALMTRNTASDVVAKLQDLIRRYLITILHLEPNLDGVFGYLSDRSVDGDGSHFILRIGASGGARLQSYYRQVKLQRVLLNDILKRVGAGSPSEFRRIRARRPKESFVNENDNISPGFARLWRSDLVKTLPEAEVKSSIEELGPIIEPLRKTS
tara:strand:+ start:1521 stop:2603 length:1083 start_codon:yes stop_codon:yes gene_type:complete